MSRLSIWNSGKRSNDYKFFDRTISEYFGVCGTAVYVHLYIGPYNPGTAAAPDINPDTDPLNRPIPGQPPSGSAAPSLTSIQDVLFLENRDRQYSNTVFELRGLYNVADSDFDLRQFALFIQNDTIFIEFHLHDMIAQLGRRLISGDVIELPHLRDDTVPGDVPVMNKFYVVQDTSFASGGYSATWYPHIWRCKIAPMQAAQEFDDILAQNATNPLGLTQGKIGDLFTTLGNELSINEQIIADAVQNVPKRYFEEQQFYMVGPDEGVYPRTPWLFAGGGDAVPPNGAVLVGQGTQFPQSPAEDAYYLRTDYHPAALFQWKRDRWVMQEVDWRGVEWNVASRILKTFIRNDHITTMQGDGLTFPEKQNLSQAVTPRADF